MAAQCHPNRVALINDDRAYTYSELHRAALNAASLFRVHAVEYVSVLDVSSVAVPIALFGAAAAGITYVPLNYRLPQAEIDALKARISPCYMIDESTRDAFLQKTITTIDAAVFEPVYDGELPAVQLFTSGTTGRPKAAILRHKNLMSYIIASIEFAVANEEDRALVAVPPYHIAGISAVLSNFYSARAIVLLPDFSPRGWCESVEKYQVSSAFVVPTMLTRIIEYLDSVGNLVDLGSVKALAYGGGKMPLSTIQKAMSRLPGVAFANAYGLTETSSTIALFGPEDHRRAYTSVDPQERIRLSSVGKALPGVEIEIRDLNGACVVPGDSGMLYVRGEQVSGEYLEKNVVDNGWFPTQDMAHMDAEGYLFLEGRADDIIVRGGENISPGEIEDLILTHSAVIDACAIGIPDTEWGEAIALIVVADPSKASAGELRHLVKDNLRSSRVPSLVRFVDALPYNENGKLLRRVLRAESVESGNWK